MRLPLQRTTTVKLTKEGFEPYRTEVTLTDDEPTTPSCAPGQGTDDAHSERGPSTDHRVGWRAMGADAARIEGISASVEHTLVLSADGFQPKTLRIVGDPGEERTITDHLARSGQGSGVLMTEPSVSRPRRMPLISVGTGGRSFRAHPCGKSPRTI